MPGRKKQPVKDRAPPGVPFEKALEELEAIVRRLEASDLGIEEAMAEYEKGLASLRACRAILDEAERKLEVLVREDGGKAVARPFQPDGSEPPRSGQVGGPAVDAGSAAEGSGDEDEEEGEQDGEEVEEDPEGGADGKQDRRKKNGFLF